MGVWFSCPRWLELPPKRWARLLTSTRNRHANRPSALALFLLSTATFLPLVPLPKVQAATTGNLAITVYNVDGSPAYSLGGTTNVRLYDSTYTSIISSATIDSNSQLS